MKKWNLLHPADNARSNRIALQGGSYSLVITAVVLALLIVVNILVSILPTPMTQYDISASKLYSITSNTKVVVNALQEDVTIYWIVQSGKEDQVIENLLGKYDSLSDHIQVVKKNPDVYPTFAQQYTDETAENNSLVVECGDRSRFISYDDIYLQEADMTTYSYNTSFDVRVPLLPPSTMWSMKSSPRFMFSRATANRNCPPPSPTRLSGRTSNCIPSPCSPWTPSRRTRTAS